jgi:hypothetical protein
VGHDADDVVEREGLLREIGFLGRQAEAAVEMEAADLREVVALGREDGLDVVARGLGGGDIAVAQAAVYLDEGLFLRVAARAASDRSKRPVISFSPLRPRTRRSEVTGKRRLRSIFT